jgi:GNAT superfamily N-acetyltransferase
VEEIGPWRDLYRQEMNCQIVGDSIDERPGWTQPYLLGADEQTVGYASIAIGGPWKGKPTMFQFFVLPQFRGRVFDFFTTLVTEVKPVGMEAQTTDIIPSVMLQAFCTEIVCESILFHDRLTTTLKAPGAVVRKAGSIDEWKLGELKSDTGAEWLLEVEGRIVGTGGILYHYNRPYGEIYMAVAEGERKKGYGAYLVQELKRICYDGGSIPGARCNPNNVASRKTLQKAGFVPRGSILVGEFR